MVKQVLARGVDQGYRSPMGRGVRVIAVFVLLACTAAACGSRLPEDALERYDARQAGSSRPADEDADTGGGGDGGDLGVVSGDGGATDAGATTGGDSGAAGDPAVEGGTTGGPTGAACRGGATAK